MSLEYFYSSEVRRQIRQFPVWRPGDPVAPGDIGNLDGGVFQKQTTLNVLFPKLKFKTVREHLNNPYLFTSSGSRRGAVHASGSNIGGVGVVPSATMKIDFGAKGGIVFAATELTRERIDELHHVREYVKAHKREWPKGMVLAAVVESAGKFRVIVSESKNGSLTLSGDAKAVGVVNIADAGVTVTMDNAAGYDSSHASGPIAVRPYGFSWLQALRGRLQLFEHDGTSTEEDDSFEEISAEDFPEDEG